MKKTIIAAIALFSMVGCNTQIIETPTEAEFGYIDLGISTETEMVITKVPTTMTPEQLADYDIVLKKGDTDVWSKKYSEIVPETQLKLAAGNYTITAANMDENAEYSGKGQVRVKGTATVEVKAGATTPCTIGCTPVNSKVSFKYTGNFKTVFPTINSLNVVDGDRSVEMEASLDSDQKASVDVAYFPAGNTLTWNLSAKNNDAKSRTYSGTFTTKVNNWSVVTFDVKGTDGSFTITITVDDITEVINESVEIDPFGGEEAAE